MAAEPCPKCRAPIPEAPDWISRPCQACGAIPAKVYAAARAREQPPAPPTPVTGPAPAYVKVPPASREPMSRTSKIVAASVGVVLLCYVIGSVIFLARNGWRLPKDAPAPAFSADDARFRCRTYLRERLHDPGSAEWVEERVVPFADGFAVTMRVRARNAFNALRLNDYLCSLTASGGLISIQSLK